MNEEPALSKQAKLLDRDSGDEWMIWDVVGNTYSIKPLRVPTVGTEDELKLRSHDRDQIEITDLDIGEDKRFVVVS